MGQDLYATYPAARAVFEEADDLLGFSLSHLCFEGPEDVLTDTLNVQPALLTVSIALLHAIEAEFGNLQEAAAASTDVSSTNFVAGHSLGEYTALVAAGSLTFADGVQLVRERGRVMKEAGEANPGKMAAILGLEEEQVAAICKEATSAGGIAVVANDNCPGQVVISGDQPGMDAAMTALQEAGARKIVPLAITIAAHSPLMQPAAAEWQQIIDAAPIVSPQIPVIANTSAQPLTTVEAIRTELTMQLLGNVRWTPSMQFALEVGVTQFVEIGPGDVLAKLMKRINRKSKRQSVSNVESVQRLVEGMS